MKFALLESCFMPKEEALMVLSITLPDGWGHRRDWYCMDWWQLQAIPSVTKNKKYLGLYQESDSPAKTHLK